MINISETEFSDLMLRILKIEAAMNASVSHTSATPKVISTINIWAISPLDPICTCFSKALKMNALLEKLRRVNFFALIEQHGLNIEIT